MIRWTFVCLLLSVSAVAAVWAITPNLKTVPSDPTSKDKVPAQKVADVPEQPVRDAPSPSKPPKPPVTSGPRPQPQLIEYVKQNQQALLETIVIPDGRLVNIDQQEVPSEKEGVILFYGTVVKPGETVSPEKQLPDAQLGFLAVPFGSKDQLREGEKTFKLYGKDYRRLRDDDQLEPHKIALATERRPVRRLQVGDRVERGQLLAMVDPKKSFDDVSMKVAKLDGADFDKQASEKKKEESHRRYVSQMEQNRRQPGSVPKDEWMKTLLERDIYEREALTKGATVTESQRALNAALTDLRMHEIRAAIDGVVKEIYKNQGDAVKPYEPVLQIQNPSRLRVQSLLDIQQSQKLAKGMRVYIEASRPEHPLRIISGHFSAVNCVAVSKGKQPIIVSGSDDETLGGWDATSGDKLWRLQDLNSAVRAVACTPPAAKRNLALFGTADGIVRLLDLDNPKGEKLRELAERHQGAVNGVAFSPDGERCATCSDDYAICLWNTETGELLYRLPTFHRAPVTSVQFASATRLVSASRDNRLAVWNVEAGKPPRRLRVDFEGRGGEVAQIGVSPDGKTVLFDQGKELRLLSLDKETEGTLQNPSEESNFSTMALFSPDGKTILTNAGAAGKLQLWRTPTGQARASELRKFIWTKGMATCGAFAPEDGSFVVTGTKDKQVLVWAMPSKEEVESHVEAHLTLVEKQLDTQSRQVRVWAELQAPEWLFPGMRATMVIPPQQAK
ncbi:MAG TPA: HlyD family efflux transporter periplasmic adaptor subunit [Gemmataceae bacterium]|jgi:WD40 repeat protein